MTGRARLEVLCVDGRRITRRMAEFRFAPLVVARWQVDWRERERGQARELRKRLAGVEVSPFLFRRASRRDRSDGGRRDVERQAAACTALSARLRMLEHRLPDDLAAMTTLLQQRGHLDGFGLTDAGGLLARLYHPQALLVAESLAAGCFAELDPEMLAGVCGAFRSGSTRLSSTAAAMPNTLRGHVRGIADVAEDLNRAEVLLGLPETPGPDATYVGAVYRWAAGDSLAAVLDGGALLPGDFVREIRQTLELLDQVAAVAPDLPCEASARLIDRAAAAASLHDPFER